MEGSIIKLCSDVHFYDPGVQKNLLNKIPEVYIIKVQFDGFDKPRLNTFWLGVKYTDVCNTLLNIQYTLKKEQ